MNIVDVLPRIALHDRVILPELVIDISKRANSVSYTDIVTDDLFRDGWNTVKLKGARFDRPTGLRDKAGKMIYENDRVKEADQEGTVAFKHSRFMTEWDNGVLTNAYGLLNCAEITGMAPYTEAQ